MVMLCVLIEISISYHIPINKVHGANMEPIRVLSAPVSPMNLAIRDVPLLLYLDVSWYVYLCTPSF